MGINVSLVSRPLPILMSNNGEHRSSHKNMQSAIEPVGSSTEELLSNSASDVERGLNNPNNDSENGEPDLHQTNYSNPLFQNEEHSGEKPDVNEEVLQEEVTDLYKEAHSGEALNQNEEARVSNNTTNEHQEAQSGETLNTKNSLSSETTSTNRGETSNANEASLRETSNAISGETSNTIENSQFFHETPNTLEEPQPGGTTIISRAAHSGERPILRVKIPSNTTPPTVCRGSPYVSNEIEDEYAEAEDMDPDCDIEDLRTVVENKQRTEFDTTVLEDDSFVVSENKRKVKWKWVLGGVVLFLIVATAVTVPTTLHFLSKKEIVLPEGEDRWIECPAKNGRIGDETTCRSKGCLWQESRSPWPSCYFPPDTSHYLVEDDALETTNNTLYVTLRNNSDVNLFGKPHETVTLKIDCSRGSRITVKIYPGKDEPVTDQSDADVEYAQGPLGDLGSDYVLNVSRIPGEEFFLEIVRNSTGQKIWDSQLADLLVEEGFIQVGSALPSSYLYGMAENGHGTKLRRDFGFKIWPLFSRGTLRGSPKFQDRLNRNSVHPFYMNLEDDGRANGVLFKTQYPSEYILLGVPGIVFRTIGPYLEFVIIVGESPHHVSQELAEVIGGAPLPPMWALGLHMAPSGDPRPVINDTRAANIPLESVHLCPSLWEKEMVFDKDKILSQQLYRYFKENADINWVLTLSPAVHASPDYLPFRLAQEDEYLMTWPPSQDIPINQRDFPPGVDQQSPYPVMFGKRPSADFVAFFDFENPLAQIAWLVYLRQVEAYHFNFTGVLTVENEPWNPDTNGIPEGCSEAQKAQCWALKCPDNSWDSPPYLTAASFGHGPSARLSDGTLCMGAQHFGHKHLEVHNNYGMNMALQTYRSCTKEHRCFVMSRSTSYTPSDPPNTVVKLLDQKEFSWEAMKASLVSILEFSLLGMPLVASDICGDYKQPDEKLCLRWVQLGAFLPIFRTRITTQGKDQNVRQGILSSPLAKDWARRALRLRLSLLPYIYSVLYRSETRGEPLLRPLFYEFPNDTRARDIDEQFMFGPAFMVAPVLDPKINQSIQVYFPNDIWYRIKGESSTRQVSSPTSYREIRDIDENPFFARGGHIVPFQNIINYTDVQSMSNGSITLKIFPKEGQATGFLYVDDGISKDSISQKKYFHFSFVYEKCRVTVTRDHSYEKLVPRTIYLKEIILNDWDSLRSRILHSDMNSTGPQIFRVNGNPGFDLKPYPDHKMLILEANVDLREDKVSHEWNLDWSRTPYCLFE